MPRPNVESCDVVILGAGLAGLAAGAHLAERGVPVTVIETRKQPAGRAGSFNDKAMGTPLDNCQHVLMGCCTRLRAFLGRLGVENQIHWHDKLYFADCAGRIETLKGAPLPAPLHWLPALLRWRALGWRDRWAIARAVQAIRRLSVDEQRALDQFCFLDWLRHCRQTERAMRNFWAPVIVSACNERLDRVSARYAAQVMREGFLAGRDYAKLGVPATPLCELYAPAVAFIRARGGHVHFGESVQRIDFDAERVSRVVTNARAYHPAGLISALPFERLTPLVNESARQKDVRLDQAGRLKHSPIIGIHLFIECCEGRPVMTLPHLALTQSALHWVFNKGMRNANTSRHDNKGTVQYLQGVISAAYDLIDEEPQTIRKLVINETERVIRVPLHERVREARVIKERRATFAAVAGVDRDRPITTGAITNFYLAGDWVNTDWPATMEGAVRSGEAAASCLMECRREAEPNPNKATAEYNRDRMRSFL